MPEIRCHALIKYERKPTLTKKLQDRVMRNAGGAAYDAMKPFLDDVKERLSHEAPRLIKTKIRVGKHTIRMDYLTPSGGPRPWKRTGALYRGNTISTTKAGSMNLGATMNKAGIVEVRVESDAGASAGRGSYGAILEDPLSNHGYYPWWSPALATQGPKILKRFEDSMTKRGDSDD